MVYNNLIARKNLCKKRIDFQKVKQVIRRKVVI